ncbi:MAG: site-specific tyrosine recombinase XerC, partial [Polaromonas sp.]
MLRPHRITPRSPAAPQPSAANPLHSYKRSFCDWTTVMGLSANTASMRQWALDHFIAWIDERGIRHPGEVTRPILQRYQRHLYLLRKKNGQPLAWSSQVNRLTPIVAFFKWLTREGHILTNPAADLDLPKAPQRLPKHLLSVAQVSQVLNQPDITTLAGLRDRAMLETLYSSGIRRSELAHLKITEVDTERGTLMVRLGKGAKDRFVPLGERACAWVQRYLLEVRPELLSGDTLVLFLSDWAQPFEPHQLSALARRYMQAAGFSQGSCHALRHACATHMLDGGADIRFIQALLGHSELGTTQIYTHVAIAKLQAVHALTHPARLERVQLASEASPQAQSKDAATALLEALAGEGDDD